MNKPPQASSIEPMNLIVSPAAESKLRSNAIAGFAVAILLTCLLSFLSGRMADLASDDAGWVAHTLEVSTVLEATLRHLVDVESGGRGFALTGDHAFLEPFDTGKDAVAQDLARLRRLTADNADQQRRLDTLAKQASIRIEAVQSVVNARQNAGKAPADSQFEQGRQLMDRARATIAEMEEAEKRLLAQRTERARATQRFNLYLIAVGAVSGVIFLCAAGAIVSRQIGISAQARAQVVSLNVDLERRVEQRTEALQAEIASRKEAETQLRASEEVFRALLDGVKDYAVYMLDAEGYIATWNSGAARIKGYLAEEIIGEHVSCFFTETDRENHHPQKSLQGAASSGRFEEEGWRVRKDGSRFWANSVIAPLFHADGSLRGYCKVVRDVTDRKQAEDEIRKQAALLDLAHDAIIVRDLESRVLFWNRGAQDLYGWSADEARGRVTHDLLQTKFPLPLAEIEAALASNGDWEGELRHATQRGAEVVVASRWSLQGDQNGLPARILEINRDITDRKQAETALRESEGRVAGIVQSAMDAIITVDDEQRIVLFNNAAEMVFLCTAEEALGSPIARFVPQRFHEAHERHIRRFGETGITNRAMGHKDVLWAVRADGQEFPIEASISQTVTGGKKLFTIILRDITERRQAEAARESLAAIVESSDDAIISKTLDGTILAWNHGAEKVFGYSCSEAIGKQISIIIPTEHAHEETDILARIGRGESVEHFETVRVRKDGSEIDVSVTISPIRDRNGVVIAASKIARDITERKRVEAALQLSEERLRLTLEGARLGTWQRNLATGEVIWSPLCFSLFGIPPETKASREDLRAIMHPDDRVLFDRATERSIEERGECDVEYRILWPDGTERWLASKGKVYQNAAGEVTHMAGIVFDITERRRAAQKLASQAEELSRQAEELMRSQRELESQTLMLQSVLDSMNEGLVAADENGKFILWNAAATRIIGMGADDVPPNEWKSHYGVYLPDTITPLPDEQNPLPRAIRGEVSTAEIFIRNPKVKEGVWLEIGGGPLKGKDGSARGGVVAFRDITQKKAAELEIRKLNESLEERIKQRTAQLEAANRELEAFTYSVSHDLRSPLRHIQGFVSACLEEFGATVDPQALHYLQRIQEGTRRMGLLINELLNLARTGRWPLNLQPTGLNAIVEEIITMLNAEVEGREVEWRIGELPATNCDPVLARQIFQNLLSNAIKYTRPRAHAVIEIGHTEEKGGTAIFVRDNGVGFNMQYADKLFGVFQRLHRDDEFEGTGVGLATVFRIVQKHGGRIWAEAEVDRGAAFYFTLGSGETPIPPSSAVTAGG